MSHITPPGSGTYAPATGSPRYAKKGRTTKAQVPALDLTVKSPAMSLPPTRTLTGPGGSSPIGSPTVLAHDTTQVTRLGMVPATVSQFSVDYDGNSVNGLWTRPLFAVEFWYYETTFVVPLHNIVNGTGRAWLFVDGHPATVAPEDLGMNSGGGSIFRWQITFPDRRFRRIRLYLFGADFGGLEIPVTAGVVPTGPPAFTLGVYGDSFIEGTGSNGQLTSLAATVGRMLGTVPFVAGQGGTGYTVTPGGGLKATYTDSSRIAAMAAAAPQYLLIVGSSNDDGVSSGSITTAAASVYAQFATALPDTKIVVVGPPSGPSPSANRLANRTAVKAAADAASNVLGFLDPLAAGLITGSGYNTADGTAYYFMLNDGSVHYNQDGHDMYARWIAPSFLNLLEATL